MRLLFTFFLSIISVALFAQTGAIKGILTAEDKPMPYANVFLKGTDHGTATDKNGFYHLSNLPPGNYELVVSFLGYAEFKQSVVIQSGQTLTINAELEPDGESLEQIVITGTRKPVYITQSPVKVEVITAKHIEKTNANNVVEAIFNVNGINEQVDCGVCFTNNIRINGLEGPYTMVLVDGMPMYSNLATVYGLNSISSSLIDRIEVIKGPNSTLYGSEAMAGVINIITKEPEHLPLLSFNSSISINHLESANTLTFSKVFNNASAMLSADYYRMHHYIDENADGFSDIVNTDRISLFNKWSFKRKQNREAAVAIRYFSEDRRGGVEDFLSDHKELRGNDSIYGESIFTKRYELFGSYALPVQEHFKLDYSASHHRQNSWYGSDSYNAEQTIFYTNLMWDKKIGKAHDIVAGATIRYNYYDDNTVATQEEIASATINRPNEQWIPGLFVQDEIKLKDNFSVLAGSRIDHYTEHGLIYSPRLSTKYKPGKWSTIRTNFGTGFRVVNLFTEDHAFVSGNRQVEIVEDLKPERSYSGTLNYNHLLNIGESAATLDVDVFYTWFTNAIYPNYNVPGKIIYANTKGHKETKGLAVSFNQNFAFPLSYSAGATFMDVIVMEEDENGNLEKQKHEFSPEWSGVFTISYEWKKYRLMFDYTGKVTGPMRLPEVFDVLPDGELSPEPRPTRSKPYTVQNLQATKKLPKNLSVYGGIKNIFNFIQDTPLAGHNDPNHPPGFSPYFDAAYAYAPIHGREFYLGVQWELNSRK